MGEKKTLKKNFFFLSQCICIQEENTNLRELQKQQDRQDTPRFQLDKEKARAFPEETEGIGELLLSDQKSGVPEIMLSALESKGVGGELDQSGENTKCEEKSPNDQGWVQLGHLEGTVIPREVGHDEIIPRGGLVENWCIINLKLWF